MIRIPERLIRYLPFLEKEPKENTNVEINGIAYSKEYIEQVMQDWVDNYIIV